jgi:hypothetical protein
MEDIRMKKVIAFLLVVLSASLIYGKHKTIPAQGKKEKRHFITLCLSFPVYPAGLGYKQLIFKNVYAIGNLAYTDAESDLIFRAGAEYLFPVKILIFKFYTGTGLQFSRNVGYQFPYTSIGTQFLFFFNEIVVPMNKNWGVIYRFGFIFRF